MALNLYAAIGKTAKPVALKIPARVNRKDGRWGNRFGSGNWTGDDLKDFIWFMTHTGLRISDVVLFDIERLRGNEVFLRAKKNGGEVSVPNVVRRTVFGIRSPVSCLSAASQSRTWLIY